MINELQASFDETNQKLQQLLHSFNQENINSIPFEGSWTAAQVADHISKSQLLATGLLFGKTKPIERDPLEKSHIVKKIFLDFTTKLSSPELILPSSETLQKQDLLNNLSNTIGKINEVIQTLNLSDTCQEFSLPNIGEMTRAEWIYFIVYHTQRHIHQLENISEKLHVQIPSLN